MSTFACGCCGKTVTRQVRTIIHSSGTPIDVVEVLDPDGRRHQSSCDWQRRVRRALAAV